MRRCRPAVQRRTGRQCLAMRPGRGPSCWWLLVVGSVEAPRSARGWPCCSKHALLQQACIAGHCVRHTRGCLQRAASWTAAGTRCRCYCAMPQTPRSDEQPSRARAFTTSITTTACRSKSSSSPPQRRGGVVAAAVLHHRLVVRRRAHTSPHARDVACWHAAQPGPICSATGTAAARPRTSGREPQPRLRRNTCTTG